VTISRFAFPTDIRFGAGSKDLLAGILLAAGVRRPLVVTDRGVGGLPFFGELLDSLSGSGLEPVAFDRVWGNPVKPQVVDGADTYRAGGADSVVGIGGGAALDVAKAIMVLATHPGDLFDYEDGKAGALEITGDVPYFVALPTTAGTGSEVGRSAVISDDQTHIKKIIFSPHLLARVVLADPELMLDLPAGVTAATGFDALTHNIESYLAKDYHPICDGIALEGLRIGAANLASAVAQPHDLAARSGMLMSSMMGAIAFQKGLGVVHSTAHALGTAYDLHHGLANAVMIDHALAWNVETVPERFATMARTVGLSDDSPAGFLSWLRDLKSEVGIPPGLRTVGLAEPTDLGRLSRLAEEDTCHLNNPRPVTRADFEVIFARAFNEGAL
jgi:alcohol dehydrogenase class IV